MKFILLIATLILLGCASQSGSVVGDPLALTRVELYRNGIGYFERQGRVDGNTLVIKVRKDQINDLLKSLTVIDQSSGKVLSISLPLDPQAWQNAAQSSFTKGEVDFTALLQTLRGVRVSVEIGRGRHAEQVQGRLMIIDEEKNQMTLLNGESMIQVALDQVSTLTLVDGDVAMQMHRNLDAGMGEGMFQQVELIIRLDHAKAHEVLVSYVVEAPQWKPSYRLVLDSKDSGTVLLQNWAVVDNLSGESWDQVQLSLTAGAPIAFRYNLHDPKRIARPDLTRNSTDKQAQVAIERNVGSAKMEVPAPAPMSEMLSMEDAYEGALGDADYDEMDDEAPQRSKRKGAAKSVAMAAGRSASPRMTMSTMASSVHTDAQAVQVSGLTEYRLADRVTLPHGTASMVALINQKVPGKELFLYSSGGSGRGYEYNPYRIVRFKNETPFALEPGPLSVYANGHFVGEGISDAVAAGAVSTIPFAVEPTITVKSESETQSQEFNLLKCERGILTVERFDRLITRWFVRGKPMGSESYSLLVKQAKASGNYRLKSEIPGLEDALSHWMVPVQMPKGLDSTSIEVVEETPIQRRITLWDGEGLGVLDRYLRTGNPTPAVQRALEPILAKRREVGSIEQTINSFKDQEQQTNRRLNEIRGNLNAIANDKKAVELRESLSQDLLEFTEKGNQLARRMVELSEQKRKLRDEIDVLMSNLSLEAPQNSKIR